MYILDNTKPDSKIKKSGEFLPAGFMFVYYSLLFLSLNKCTADLANAAPPSRMRS
jgi:hypothetical protein